MNERIEAAVDLAGIRAVAECAIDFLVDEIAPSTKSAYDRLFVQVNGDTGLLLTTLGTLAGFDAGTTEGVGLRWGALAERYGELSALAPAAFEDEAERLQSAIYDGFFAAARRRLAFLLRETDSPDLALHVVDPFEPNTAVRIDPIALTAPAESADSAPVKSSDPGSMI